MPATEAGTKVEAVADVAVLEDSLEYSARAPSAVPELPEQSEEAPQPELDQAPLISVKTAMEQIDETVLNCLKEQFNGKPTQMRYADAKDRIFQNEKQS